MRSKWGARAVRVCEGNPIIEGRKKKTRDLVQKMPKCNKLVSPKWRQNGGISKWTQNRALNGLWPICISLYFEMEMEMEWTKRLNHTGP